MSRKEQIYIMRKTINMLYGMFLAHGALSVVFIRQRKVIPACEQVYLATLLLSSLFIENTEIKKRSKISNENLYPYFWEKSFIKFNRASTLSTGQAL